MKRSAPTYFQLTGKLSKFRHREAGVKAITAILNFIILVLPIVVIVLAIEALFRLSSQGRLIVLAALLVTVGALFINHVVLSFVIIFRRLKEPLFKTAMQVGCFFKSVNDRLANALQLYENYERDKDRFSLSLIEASLAKVADELKNANFNAHLDMTAMKRSLRNASVVGVVFILLGIAFFSPFSAAGYRLFHPMQDFTQQHEVNFFVHPGDATVIKGEDVRLSAVLSDSTYESVALFVKTNDAVQTIDLVKATDDSFRYKVQNVRHDLKYSFSVGKQFSKEYFIRVIERPLLRSLKLKIEPPRYAGIDAYYLDENIGDVSALKGSRVRINGVVNKKVNSAQLRFSNDRRVAMAIRDRRLSASFRIQKDDFYSVHLVDDAGNENVSPIQYKIKVIPDNFPFVQIVSPGEDIDLGDDMTIPLLVEAQDDFGVSLLRLAYQLIPGGDAEVDSNRFIFSNIQGFAANDDHVRIALNWDLSRVDMYPTDVLVYFVEAFDNDDVSGPKSARSKMYRARFPSLYEMYKETAFEQEDAADSFEEALEKSKDLQQKLEELSLEMKRSTEMDWQKKQEIEEALQRQKEIEQQLDNAIRQMDEMIEKVEKNNLFSRETMKKLEEIQNLYKEIMTPELQDVMEKMNEAMQNLDEQLLRKAMQEFKLNVEDYNKTLDRTISLLKKLKAEQKLDQALKMAQDLAERQSEITEQSEQTPADNKRLAKEQERIAKDAENLSDVLKQLQEQMKELPASPMEEVTRAAEQMQQSNLQQNLSELQQKLEQNQMNGVPQQSTQAQQSFQQMADNLQQARQMMSGEMQRQAIQAMRKGSRELLQLSQQQEQLMQQMQGMPRNSPQYMEMAEKQEQAASSLQRVVDGMAETMKNNFGIDPKVSRSLGKAMMEMENALRYLEERNSAKAAQSQGRSMAQMNAAVRGMQQSMQNMMQQGGSGGMSYQQFLQQMQQMADAQGQLNRQTQALGNPGQLTLGQQAALARLAAEQRQLRKSMEQLAGEAEGMSEILGSLEKIADDMKKVEQDFADKQITRDTINRQNRILSRMLDAQKSVNKREFSRERKAETGKRYMAKSPEALPNDLGERKNQLQQDLLRAKKEGYSRDYLKVIENYFKALTEHEMADQ